MSGGERAGLLERISAGVEEAVLSAWRRRPVTLATVGVIAIMLTCPGLAGVVLAGAAQAASETLSAQRVRVHLAPGLADMELEALRARAAALSDVSEVVHVSEEEAAAAFRVRFPELADAANELLADGLGLPASLEVTVRGGPEAARAAAAELSGLQGVADVRHDADLAADLGRLRGRLRAAAWASGLGAFALAAFGIGSVVRIGALTRREELSIMRLVGAPRFHVRAPLILEGLLQGALGGLLALGLIHVLLHALAPFLAPVLPGFVASVPAGAALALILGPALAGTLAAAVAVEMVLRRHARLER